MTHELAQILTDESICGSGVSDNLCYDIGQELFGFDSSNLNMVRLYLVNIISPCSDSQLFRFIGITITFSLFSIILFYFITFHYGIATCRICTNLFIKRAYIEGRTLYLLRLFIKIVCLEEGNVAQSPD